MRYAHFAAGNPARTVEETWNYQLPHGASDAILHQAMHLDIHLARLGRAITRGACAGVVASRLA